MDSVIPMSNNVEYNEEDDDFYSQETYETTIVDQSDPSKRIIKNSRAHYKDLGRFTGPMQAGKNMSNEQIAETLGIKPQEVSSEPNFQGAAGVSRAGGVPGTMYPKDAYAEGYSKPKKSKKKKSKPETSMEYYPEVVIEDKTSEVLHRRFIVRLVVGIIIVICIFGTIYFIWWRFKKANGDDILDEPGTTADKNIPEVLHDDRPITIVNAEGRVEDRDLANKPDQGSGPINMTKEDIQKLVRDEIDKQKEQKEQEEHPPMTQEELKEYIQTEVKKEIAAEEGSGNVSAEESAGTNTGMSGGSEVKPVRLRDAKGRFIKASAY